MMLVLTGANLTNAYLNNATDLTGANLTNAIGVHKDEDLS